MKHFALPDILDVLFYTAAVWLLSIGLMRYFRVETGVAIGCSVLFAAATALLAALLLFAGRRKKRLGAKERARRDALLLHLALEKEERVRASLLQAFIADGRQANCAEDALSVGGEIHVPVFTMQPLSADAVAALLKKYGETPFTVVCNALSPEAENLLRSFGRKAMCGDETYALFCRGGTYPEKLICGEIPRRTAKQKLARSLSKKNARPFFVCGCMLLIMSLFAIFPVYYLVTGGVLLVVSVFVRAFGYA